MAETANYRQFRRPSRVDGNLALDLDWEVRQRELTHAGEPERRKPWEETQTQTRTHTRTQVRQEVQVRQAQRVSLLAVAGIGAIAVMCILVLMSYIQLTMISTETVSLKKELQALKTDYVTLTAQYEQMFDLSTVKDAALSAGMRKPATGQITYLDISGEDSVVVYREEAPSRKTQIVSSVKQGYRAILDYFG